MELPVNNFKRNLAAGKPQIGLWMSLWAHQAVEACAPAGFDWMLLDTEHAPNEPHMVGTQLMAARGTDGQCTAHPVVRPAWNDLVMIKRSAQRIAEDHPIDRLTEPLEVTEGLVQHFSRDLTRAELLSERLAVS